MSKETIAECRARRSGLRIGSAMKTWPENVDDE